MDAGNPGGPGPQNPGGRRCDLMTQQIQTWTALAAVVVSAAALVVAVSASRDQRAMNDSQLGVNSRQEQAYETEDAARVSMSDPVAEPQAMMLRVENLSTAVIKDVVLFSGSRLTAILLNYLSPCSSVTVSLPAISGGQPTESAASWADGVLYFHDPQHLWARDTDGLHTVSDKDSNPLIMLAQQLADHGPAVVVTLYQNSRVSGIYPLPSMAVGRSPVTNCPR